MNAKLESTTLTARSPELNEEERRYMCGDVEPVTSSVLISSSKFLNNPTYRDVFAQACLRRQGNDLPSTYLVPSMIKAMAEVTDRIEIQRLIDAEKEQNPEFADWLKARPECRYRPADVAHFAQGTLGAAVHAFLINSGLQMEYMYKEEAADDIAFISKRQQAVHDICHLVSGFDPNIVGEVALQLACMGAISRYFTPALAQHINATNAFACISHFSRISHHYQAVMPTLLEGMHLGSAMGLALEKPLFMYDWETYLDWLLEDIAVDMGIVRGPGAKWYWTDEAASG